MPELIRVGHRGAPALAPENTIASFEAAREVGVDMIEFDVLPARRRASQAPQLYVAHDYGVLTADSLTLAEALAHFATPPYAGIRLQLDIKRGGMEEAVLAALRASGTLERAFVSTGARGVLARFRALEPNLPLGWTVPDVPLMNDVPLVGGLYRRPIPDRAAARVRSGQIDALVPHWSIVSRRLVESLGAAGGEVYAWTVDDAGQIARLADLGVTGVITNDPRLFG